MHAIHTAGTRTKRAGINGLSHEDFLEGVVTGKNPLEFIPLNEGADERSDKQVRKWVLSWWSNASGCHWCGHELKKLELEDWFDLTNIESP